MSNNFLPFIAGAFLASYAQNPKFRETIDKNVKNFINKGVDTLNKQDLSKYAAIFTNGGDGNERNNDKPE
jgi:archaeosine-15-forming tRNA-guanine transglycosylase